MLEKKMSTVHHSNDAKTVKGDILAKHIYVVDTCVLLHDPQAIYKFAEHDVYIPLAVIDDLDDIKTRRESVGWGAREVFRLLDQFELTDLMSKGVKVNEKGGKLFIYNNEGPIQQNQRPNIQKVFSDNAIIEAAIALNTQYPKRKVSIVTKDTALRVRAESWGCKAENYRSDLLEDEKYTGLRYVDITNIQDWNILWNNEELTLKHFSAELVNALGVIHPNEFILFRNGEFICPSLFQHGVFRILKDKKEKNGRDKNKIEFSGISPKNLEQKCAMEVLADDSIPFVTICGQAGTGKTLVTLAVALQKIAEETYERIIIIKPLIPVGGKDIGALPGDKFDKISAWLGPMKDNIEQILGSKTMKGGNPFEEMVADGAIEVEAMAFIQGRSIPNSIVIVDESQNLTPREGRMVVERCGKDSKIIFLGDLSQVENPYLDARSNALIHAMNGGKNLDQCAAVTLVKVERSSLSAVASEIFKDPASLIR